MQAMVASVTLSFFTLTTLAGALKISTFSKDPSIITEGDVFDWIVANRPYWQLVDDVVAKKHAAQAWEMKYSEKAYPWTKEYDYYTFFNYVVPITHFDEKAEEWMHIMRDALVTKALFVNRDLFLMDQKDQKLKDVAQFVVENTWDSFGAPIVWKENQTPQVLNPISDLLAQKTDKRYGSATALSIFLANSLRSVGVPARVVGVAEWKRPEGGSHNWVEAFFDDKWNFIDAMPGTKVWNKAWFTMGLVQQCETCKYVECKTPMSHIATPMWDKSNKRTTAEYFITWQKGAPESEMWERPPHVYLKVPAQDLTWFYKKQPTTMATDIPKNDADMQGGSRLASSLTVLPMLAMVFTL